VLDGVLMDTRAEPPVNRFLFDAPDDLVRGEAFTFWMLTMKQCRSYP
jgi:hypothetical protein